MGHHRLGTTRRNFLKGTAARLALGLPGRPFRSEAAADPDLVVISGDPAGVQFAGGGVPSLTLNIPSRYTHGPVEGCSLKDVAATADLLAAALRAIGPETRFEFIQAERTPLSGKRFSYRGDSARGGGAALRLRSTVGGLQRCECFRRNSAIRLLPVSPRATERTVWTSAVLVRRTSLPLRARNTNAATVPVRLFPSTKG